jgi:hypothetical protein
MFRSLSVQTKSISNKPPLKGGLHTLTLVLVHRFLLFPISPSVVAVREQREADIREASKYLAELVGYLSHEPIAAPVVQSAPRASGKVGQREVEVLVNRTRLAERELRGAKELIQKLEVKIQTLGRSFKVLQRRSKLEELAAFEAKQKVLDAYRYDDINDEWDSVSDPKPLAKYGPQDTTPEGDTSSSYEKPIGDAMVPESREVLIEDFASVEEVSDVQQFGGTNSEGQGASSEGHSVKVQVRVDVTSEDADGKNGRYGDPPTMEPGQVEKTANDPTNSNKSTLRDPIYLVNTSTS